MRTFLYISDSKVDMMFPQINLGNEGTTGLGLTLNAIPGVGASVSREHKPLENRVNRLCAVEKFVRRNRTIGSVDSNLEWIDGTAEALPVQFAKFPTLFFLMLDSPKHLFALSGTAHNRIGLTKPADITCNYSYFPDLMNALWDIHDAAFTFLPQEGPERTERAKACITCHQHPWTTVLEFVATQVQRTRVPKLQVSFLTQRLVSEVSGGRRYSISTPLYVENSPSNNWS